MASMDYYSFFMSTEEQKAGDCVAFGNIAFELHKANLWVHNDVRKYKFYIDPLFYGNKEGFHIHCIENVYKPSNIVAIKSDGFEAFGFSGYRLDDSDIELDDVLVGIVKFFLDSGFQELKTGDLIKRLSEGLE